LFEAARLQELASRIEALLRSRSKPVALGFLKEKLDGALEADKLDVKVLRLCQMITLSRTHGWIIQADKNTLAYTCSYVAGLIDELPPELANEYAKYWFRNVEEGLVKLKELYRVPKLRHSVVITAPLDKARFTPNLILWYLNPAQACIALSALQWHRYRRFTFTYSGESACADSIAKCMVTHEPSLTVPCFGERRFGHLQDDELVLSLPPEALADMAEGLQQLYMRGVRYPIPYLGVQADTIIGLPKKYRRFYE